MIFSHWVKITTSRLLDKRGGQRGAYSRYQPIIANEAYDPKFNDWFEKIGFREVRRDVSISSKHARYVVRLTCLVNAMQ